MDLLLFLKIEILCWRIMTPSLRGGSISLGYAIGEHLKSPFNCNRCGFAAADAQRSDAAL
ncbi:hypothetical protein D6219_08890 [Coxiella burnetii]|nr:hypothetical protein D6219_08890 [Coxiella burnetii]PNT86806.1 hypothetical protein C2L93_01655 [Coxiella burnetii]